MPLWGFGSFEKKISFYLVGVSINLGSENSVAHLTTHFGGQRLSVKHCLERN